MKKLIVYTLLISAFAMLSNPVYSQEYIADYTVAKEGVLRSIPQSYIDKAREELIIAYQHTSHGTHVSKGMYGLPDYKAGDDVLFAISRNSQVAGKLSFYDEPLEHYPPGAKDLSAGEETFVETTRNYLDAGENAEVNVVMWAWCDISEHDVSNNYLPDMETLIAEYGEGGSKIGTGAGQREVPVTFIFMTGHAITGHNVGDGFPKNQAQLIIDHCTANGHLCLDYYSIDTHDMDDNYWEDTGDNGNSEAYGGNFYQDWQDAHSVGDGYYENKSSPGGDVDYGTHTTQHITSNRKAYAMWWILARISGWSGDTATMVPVTNIELSSADKIVEIETGDTLRFFAEVIPVEATQQEVTWSVTNGSGTATISEGGLLSALSPGSVTVVASAKDSSGVSANFALSIVSPEIRVGSITIASEGDYTTIESGSTLQFSASVFPDEASNKLVDWSILSDTGTAVITESGFLTAGSPGNISVMASAQDGSGVTATYSLVIAPPATEVVSISITAEGDLSLVEVGDMIQLSTSVSPSNASNPAVFWHINRSSKNNGSASITEDGIFIAMAEGEVDVVAVAQDGSGINATISITILGASAIEEYEAETVILFPNPGKDLFFLNVGDLKVEQVRVVDATGTTVLERRPEPGNQVIELDLSQQRSGIYFVRVFSGKSALVKPVIITR